MLDGRIRGQPTGGRLLLAARPRYAFGGPAALSCDFWTRVFTTRRTAIAERQPLLPA